ncbi:MAG: hypothetical protein U0Q22_18955 [Acidimicrobiales bacterium]
MLVEIASDETTPPLEVNRVTVGGATAVLVERNHIAAFEVVAGPTIVASTTVVGATVPVAGQNIGHPPRTTEGTGSRVHPVHDDESPKVNDVTPKVTVDDSPHWLYTLR